VKTWFQIFAFKFNLYRYAVVQVVQFVQQFVNKVISDINTVSISNIAAGAMGAGDEDGIVEVPPGSAKQEVTEAEFDNDDTVPHTPGSATAMMTPAKGGGGARSEDGEGGDGGAVSGTEGAAAEAAVAGAEAAGAAAAGAAAAASSELVTPVKSKAKSKESEALETDAFLVFRALCKLAKKPGDLQNVAVVRGKTLSLELLKILLENAGPVFCTSPRFIEATKEYLCDAVVTNAAPSIPVCYQLACSIFLTLLTRFRKSLKAEVGFFFPMLMLKPLEVIHGTPLAPYSQRAILLMCLHKLCSDPQMLVDMFVNFDCDLDSSNLFERLVNSLVRVAQGLPGVADLTGAEAAREAVLKAEALECLSGMLEALGGWVDDMLGTGEAKTAAAAAAAKVKAAKEAAAGGAGGGGSSGALDVVATDEGAASEVSGIEQKKASKLEYQEAIQLFNKKPKKGIAMMQKMGRLGTAPEEIAEFLRCTPDLDKTVIGDYLGEREEPMLTVMHAYVDALDFTAQTLDEAIRKFLEGFRLPGESQKIDRLMEKFAERYCKQNPGAYKSADTAYVLAFSVIMLNTDAHNPGVKHKMTKEGFLRNNRGIDDGQDVDAAHLNQLYDNICNNEIRMKDENPELLAMKAEANTSGSMVNRAMKDMSNRLGMDVLMSLVAGRKMDAVIDTSAWMEEVRARAKRDASGFHTASDPACVRPMLEVAWPAMLAVFSMSFEATEAASVVQTSLMGFRRAIHLSAAMGMEAVRDAFITPLAKLTSLHSPSNMRSKNISAMRALMAVGVSDGNALGGAWVHILKAVSRYDHLYSLAAGYNDASLFEGSAGGAPDGGGGGKSSSGTGGRLFRRVGGGLAKSADAAASAMKSLKSPSISSAKVSGMSMPTMSGMFSGGGMSSMFGGGGGGGGGRVTLWPPQAGGGAAADAGGGCGSWRRRHPRRGGGGG
jgi:brefeldin A-inhibited guanine nucleotide-exchange protein